MCVTPNRIAEGSRVPSENESAGVSVKRGSEGGVWVLVLVAGVSAVVV